MNNLNELQIQKLLELSDEYERALYLVSILFTDKTDKGGYPYINHLIRVSLNVSKKNTKVAALLHDTVEDIDNIKYTEEEKKEMYHNKITSILQSGNIEAIKLKYADMSDNFNSERLKNLDKKTKERLINKYKGEIVRLEKYIVENGE